MSAKRRAICARCWGAMIRAGSPGRRPCLNWQAGMAWYCWKRAQLIDTRQGEQIQEGAAVMPPTTPEIVKGMRQISLREMQGCVYLAADPPADSRSELAAAEGIEEIPIIGAANSRRKNRRRQDDLAAWLSFALPEKVGRRLYRPALPAGRRGHLSVRGQAQGGMAGRQRDFGQGRCADRAKAINPVHSIIAETLARRFMSCGAETGPRPRAGLNKLSSCK